MSKAFPFTSQTPRYDASLGRLSDEILVRFPTRRISEARVIWINPRWAVEDKPCAPQHREEWLLESFGVFAESLSIEGSVRFGVHGFLDADRYGGTGGAVNGGSGRCASLNGYNAKGIGPTPLVSRFSDAQHRNGLMSLSEAIREVISSEVANEELPCGAVPTLAIIDTGVNFRALQDEKEHRAAIVVRPDFIRPAHFERSIFFGDSGYAESHQYKDATRVKQAIRHTASRPDAFPTLKMMFLSIARQLGAMRAKRLWQGQFLTSNITIDGALVDFGAFRSLRNWRRFSGLAGEQFGTEIRQLKRAFLSLSFYFSKYASDLIGLLDLNCIWRDIEIAESESFTETIASGLGLNNYPDTALVCEIQEKIQRYYMLQQAATLGDDVQHSTSWLSSLLTNFTEREFIAPGQETVTANDIARLLKHAICQKGNETMSIIKSIHFFKPRYHLHLMRSNLSSDFLERKFMSDLNFNKTDIELFINKKITNSVRNWKGLPDTIEVLSTRSTFSSLYISARDIRTKHELFLSRPFNDDHAAWSICS
jgi:hypothetical protein